jgi:hypothetical protein
MATATAKMASEASERNRQLVKGLYEAFMRGDIGTLLAGLDPRVVWIVPGPAEIPLSGRRTGREEVSNFFQMLNEYEEFQEFEVRQFVVENETVVALGYARAKVKSTGKTSTSTFAHVFTIVGGKVSRFEEYFDTASSLVAYRPN